MSELSIPPLPATAAQTTTDQIFTLLYGAVISLKLPPGTKVSEAEIAKQLDVSRQPVRDAFFRLSKLGFLSIRPQRATLITKISERAVLRAMFVRTALEVECTRLAAERHTPEDMDRLRANLALQAVAAQESQGPQGFHELDEQFHLILCEIAGHGHVWDLIQEQKGHMDRVRFLTLSESRRRQVHCEHVAIVDAIEARDPVEAERLQRIHLGNVRYVVKAIRAEHADYFEETA